MAAGVCVYMCVRLSIFIKARVTSKGDWVSRYCELSEGGAQGRTVWILFKSLRRMKRFGVLWPLWTTWQMSSNQSKWVWLCSRGTDTRHHQRQMQIAKNIHYPAGFIGITSLAEQIQTGLIRQGSNYTRNTTLTTKKRWRYKGRTEPEWCHSQVSKALFLSQKYAVLGRRHVGCIASSASQLI